MALILADQVGSKAGVKYLMERGSTSTGVGGNGKQLDNQVVGSRFRLPVSGTNSGDGVAVT